jgi:hypothetical protein
MENKFKIIETEEYTLAVSEKEIKHGEGLIPNEWYINSYRGYDKPFKNHNLDSNGYLKRVFAYQPKNNAPTLDLPLLPELVVEDDVELELKNFKSSNVLDILNMGNINYLSNGDIVYNPDLLFIKRNDRWFSKHKSATKTFSEEDLRKAFDFGTNEGYNYKDLESMDEEPEELSEEDWNSFVRNLNQPKTPKWFVAEIKSIYNKEAYEIEESKMELKTTSKNGKKYLVGTYLYE